MSAVLQWKIENTTDATRGQPLAARVLARKAELEDALADCGRHEALRRTTLETALAGVYALITGFCFAAFTAYVLETIGKSDRTAATKYSLFTAAANIAITYTGWIDTRFNERHGVEGVVGSDAALNLIGVAVLAVVFWRLGSFGKWRHPAETANTPGSATAGELPAAVARITDER